jgi:hypothetical protein
MIPAVLHPCFTVVAECAGTRSKDRRGFGAVRVRRAFLGSASRGIIHDTGGVEGVA